MSHLKDKLIRLGYQSPDLRGHLRTILAKLDKEAADYTTRFQVEMKDARSGKVEWRGPVSEFLEDNPEMESDVMDLRRVGDSIVTGGGAMPLFEIERIS